MSADMPFAQEPAYQRLVELFYFADFYCWFNEQHNCLLIAYWVKSNFERDPAKFTFLYEGNISHSGFYRIVSWDETEGATVDYLIEPIEFPDGLVSDLQAYQEALSCALRCIEKSRSLNPAHLHIKFEDRSNKIYDFGYFPGDGEYEAELCERNPRTQSEVKINGEIQWVELFPKFYKDALSMPNEEFESGPHTEVCISKEVLIQEILQAEDKDFFEITLNRADKEFGRITEVSGYYAIEGGKRPRLIESATISFSRELFSTRINVRGHTGFLQSEPFIDRDPEKVKIEGIYVFDIWARIWDANIDLHCRDDDICDAMQLYAAKHRSRNKVSQINMAHKSYGQGILAGSFSQSFFVEIDNWDEEAIKDAPEYQTAFVLHKNDQERRTVFARENEGYPMQSWIDRRNKYFLFLFSVQTNKRGRPGECLLCIDGRLLHIKIRWSYEWIEDKQGYKHEYLIEGVENLGTGEIDQQFFLPILKDALLAAEAKSDWVVLGVNVKFGVENN
ncbi:hypothetical protein [Parachitinimonas caeni]|uniref:Uncharacterized protein n=1 Tax=Parachitinimonas caeni TaxID=3031301 RepID=A0ABT7E355_9NEIS|nr:hypothetical protein [Parachitinimonas caeni]MDK2125830.1 hypothetical protein [Parachitinimonas caeni]